MSDHPSPAIAVWQCRNDKARTFSFSPTVATTSADGANASMVEKTISAQMVREQALAKAGGRAMLGEGEEETPRVRGNVQQWKRRAVLTPLAGDLSPPRAVVASKITQPLPESALGTIESLRRAAAPNNKQKCIYISDNKQKDVSEDDTAADNDNTTIASTVLSYYAPQNQLAAAKLLSELSLMEAYVPPKAMRRLLDPPRPDGHTATHPRQSLGGSDADGSGAEEEDLTAASVAAANSAANALNPHGEPITFVSCSAAVGHVGGDVSAASEDADGLKEFSILRDDYSSDPARNLLPLGLPPPHSLVRKSRRGLAEDAAHHAVPIREGGRHDRALLFLAQLKDAGAAAGGGLGLGGLGAEGGGDAQQQTAMQRLARNQWVAVDHEKAAAMLLAANAKENAHAATGNDGSYIHTVTTTSKADRNGLNRFHHKFVQNAHPSAQHILELFNKEESNGGSGDGDGDGSIRGISGFSRPTLSQQHQQHHPSPHHPNQHQRFITANQAVTHGPSHVGTTFVVSSELERNRLRAMQSRVLIPTVPQQYSTESSELAAHLKSQGNGYRFYGFSAANGSRSSAKTLPDGRGMSSVAFSSPSRTRYAPALASLQQYLLDGVGGDASYRTFAAEVEAAAVMGDAVEVDADDWKITSLPAPTQREAAKEKEMAGRVVRSQKERARELLMGGVAR